LFCAKGYITTMFSNHNHGLLEFTLFVQNFIRITEPVEDSDKKEELAGDGDSCKNKERGYFAFNSDDENAEYGGP
jgi:hypothetical protein